jgi:hypothetical protein
MDKSHTSRRTCTCEYGLPSRRGKSADVVSDHPPETPHVLHHFSSVYGDPSTPVWNLPLLRERASEMREKGAVSNAKPTRCLDDPPLQPSTLPSLHADLQALSRAPLWVTQTTPSLSPKNWWLGRCAQRRRCWSPRPPSQRRRRSPAFRCRCVDCVCVRVSATLETSSRC